MTLVMDSSPAHSSSSDDFAAFLDAQLDTNSDVSLDQEVEIEEEDQQEQEELDQELEQEQELEQVEEDGEQQEKDDDFDDKEDDDHNNDDFEKGRIKRTKLEMIESGNVLENVVDSQPSTSQEASTREDLCTHPGVIGGLCFRCGKKLDDESGVPFGYIYKDLRLASGEIARLRETDLKSLLRHRKLCLVLDLDHTLLNSTRMIDITGEEEYLKNQADPIQDALKDSLFRLDFMHMMTKLRPFVRTFLKEASDLFEMYIYTMGERAYAIQMAKLLDPYDVYFSSRVIAQGDCTQKHQKGLDVVLGKESVVLILDDTEPVWVKHKDNLILMERYHFFASSCRQFGFKCKSLSEQRSDESEADGALATVLNVLKKIHTTFFDEEHVGNLEERDVRQVLKTMRKQVLQECKIVFSRVFPTMYRAENHHMWKMAEQLGATCLKEIEPSVTHVVSTDSGTEKSRWAIKENKFLVLPQWIEAANYLWKRQSEDMFPVSQPKNQPTS